MLGLADDRTSTNEQARPIPYMAGWQRVGVTWCAAPRNQKSTPVTSGAASGKGASKAQPSSYKYFADMVALVCLGGQVRLFCKRGKCDTGQLDHVAGEAVFIIAKRSLRPVAQDTYANDNSVYYKVQAATDTLDGNLATIASVNVPVIGRALMPQPFRDLMVDGTPALSSPTYAAGSDIAMSWTLTTNELFGNEVADVDYFAQSGIGALINIYDSAGSLVQMRHVRLDPGIASWVYSDSNLVADFGGRPASFYVRLWAKKAGRKSFSFEQSTITKA